MGYDSSSLQLLHPFMRLHKEKLNVGPLEISWLMCFWLDETSVGSWLQSFWRQKRDENHFLSNKASISLQNFRWNTLPATSNHVRFPNKNQSPTDVNAFHSKSTHLHIKGKKQRQRNSPPSRFKNSKRSIT